MKILIADDELLIREGLKSMLNELYIPLEIVGEAANGRELISQVKKHKPDVVFADIKMPGITGLDAIDECKKFTSDTEWIILTGFSEFEFAKSAINLGVSYYLTKPVSIEELHKVLLDVSERMKNKAFIRNKEFENEISPICQELVISDDVEAYRAVTGFTYECALLIIDSYLNEQSKSRQLAEYYGKIRSLIEEMSTRFFKVALFSMPNGELTIVTSGEDSYGSLAERHARNFYIKLEEMLRSKNKSDFKASILKSEKCRNYEAVRKSINQLQNLSPLRSVAGIGRIVGINELVRIYKEADSNLLELCNTLVRTSQAFKDKEYLNYLKGSELLARQFAAAIPAIGSRNKEAVIDFLDCSINFKIDADFDKNSLAGLLSNHGNKLVSESRDENRVTLLADKVAAFIESNYMNDIGIAEIAQNLDVTPNYLSSLFHKHMGTTYIKYLTKVRMIKAKELLGISALQVQQVAEQVGYYSVRHFTKLFKEYYNCYPSEYRKGQC